MADQAGQRHGDELLHTSLDAWLRREIRQAVAEQLYSPDFLRTLAIELTQASHSTVLAHPHLERKEKT